MEFQSKNQENLKKKKKSKIIDRFYFNEDGENNESIESLKSGLASLNDKNTKLNFIKEYDGNYKLNLYIETDEEDKDYHFRINRLKIDDIVNAASIIYQYKEVLKQKEEILDLIKEIDWSKYNGSDHVGFLKKAFSSEVITQLQLDEAYQRGKIDGAKEERARIKKNL